jgi:hypothetical protein
MVSRALGFAAYLIIVSATQILAQGHPLPSRLDLQPIVTFGELEGSRSLTFGLIQDLVATGSSIVILDRRFQELRTFDAQGKHIQTLGRPGRGPGEFYVPQAISQSSDQILTLDPANARISKYQTHGDSLSFAGSFPIDFTPSDFCVLDQTLYLVGYRDRQIVHGVTLDGEAVRSFGVPSGPDHELLRHSLANSFVTCVPKLDLIIIKSVLGPEMLAYTPAGGVVWSTRIPDFTKVLSEQNLDGSITYRAPTSAGHDIVSSTFYLPPNMIVVQVGLSSRETGPKEELINVRSYVYSAESGALLFRQESLPRFIYADHTNIYSVVNRPFPTVTVYRYFSEGRTHAKAKE